MDILCRAVLLNDFNLLKYLINKDNIDINKKNSNGITLLEYTCFFIEIINPEIIKYIINCGADIKQLKYDTFSREIFKFYDILIFLLKNNAQILNKHTIKEINIDILIDKLLLL